MEKVSKPAVNYREATGKQSCGNCGMFNPDRKTKYRVGKCDLVLGIIYHKDTCDEWVKDEG